MIEPILNFPGVIFDKYLRKNIVKFFPWGFIASVRHINQEKVLSAGIAGPGN
jgi:hypothetical protein